MRIVIKVGTSTLAHKTGGLNIRRVERLCRTISDLKNEGHEIVLVSSGAIGVGAGKLLIQRPTDVPGRQAAAAVGQCELMYTYDKLFGEYNHVVAQILLTAPDVADEQRNRNFQNTVFKLLELGVLPIINENDAVNVDELVVGDNDTLAALAASSVGADLLILLSDIKGLYTADPHRDASAQLIPLVTEFTPQIMAAAGGRGSEFGTGGMETKLRAAQLATQAGIDMIIANGQDPDILYDAVAGKPVGTRFAGVKK